MTYDLRKAILARIDRARAGLGELLADELQTEIAPFPSMVTGSYWPAGLPLPLTVAQALDAADAGRELLADNLALDIRDAVAAMVKREAQAAVLARPELPERWHLRRALPGCDAATQALVRLWRQTDKRGGGRWTAADMGLWPEAALSHLTVAEWARDTLNRIHSGAGDTLLELVKAHGAFYEPVLLDPDAPERALWPADLALLYIVERDTLAVLPWTLDNAALDAVRSWETVGPGDVHNAAATAALANGDAADNQSAIQTLAAALHRVCPDLVAAVTTGPIADVPGFLTAAKWAKCPVALSTGPRERDGMLTLDANLADWMATLDPAGADKLRGNARERLAEYKAGELDVAGLFERWANGGARRLANAARTLWRVRVAEQWERLQLQHPAALSGVLDLLIHTSYGAQFELNLGAPVLRNKLGKITVEFDTIGLDADTLKSMFTGRTMLATVAGTKLVRWELLTAHRNYIEFQSNGGDFRQVKIDGGWSGLTERIGENSKSAVQNVRAMMLAQAHGRFNLPNGAQGNLLSYEEPKHAAPGKPSILKIIFGDALLPGYVYALPAGRAGESHRRNRVLVPILDNLPELRKIVGRGSIKGSKSGELSGQMRGLAALLHWLVLIDLAQGAREWQRFGGVKLDWPKLWGEAGLSAEVGAQIRASWLADGDDSPAMLEQKGDRYILGKHHEKAQEFILQRNILAEQWAKKGARKTDRKTNG